jgi:Zn-dependent peptidase ImmA (M78 family)
LGGGSAVLMREQKFIYVSTKYPVGSDQYNGLVAHELGHYYLDSAQTAKTVADLQTLFGSAGSPAIIKVEAYGARERQELQANVFGRELLLPRSVALALALAGHGPSEVAHDLGIPLEFAQQQMLDAMLLPEAHEEPTTLKSPSPDQLKAATGACPEFCV